MALDYIDTARLFVTSPTAFTTLNMSPNIQNSQACQSLKYNIDSLCVPKTYYNVFRTMSLVFSDISNVLHQIDVGMGEYTLIELLDSLVDEMTSLDGVATYVYAIDPIGGRVTITSDMIGTFTLETNDVYMAKYLGMILGQQYVSDIDTLGFSFIPDVERTKNFIIQSSLRSLRRTSFDNVVTSDDVPSLLNSANCLAGIFPCVFQSSDLSDILYHRGYYGNYSSITASGYVFPNSFNVTLVDDYLTPIYLNGSDWTMTIFVYMN